MITAYENIRRTVYARWTRFVTHSRPSSYPFISGDTFRSLADHIYDDTQVCRAEDVKKGESVFVKTDLLEKFFATVHTDIRAPYRLITHNSDREITAKELAYIDEKIIRWFAHNVTTSHPQITPLPIGLESQHYYQSGDVQSIQKLLSEETSPILDKVLYGFSPSTNPKERTDALRSLRTCTHADEIKMRLSPIAYYKKLQSYKFVAAPRGNGVDTHRVWEALLFGVIPIVRRNPVVEHFQKMGLPVLIIDTWDEIKKMTPEYLSKYYQETMRVCSPTKDNLLSWAYWQGIIRAPESMRDEAVVVVATGKKFQKIYERYFKKSHEDFCFAIRRPLIVIGDVIQKVDKRPTWQKLVMFRTPLLSTIGRVMLMDADIYIKNEAIENPLDLVPREQWGLTPNNAFNLPTLAVTDLTLYNHCPPQNRPNFVLNCGFFIINKKVHGEIMEYVFKNYDEQICDEQGPFCYHLINEFPGTILPFRFNNIVGSYMEKYGYSMTSVIHLHRDSLMLHFAGKSNRKILRLFLLFRRYPRLEKVMRQVWFLRGADILTSIIKKIRRIP